MSVSAEWVQLGRGKRGKPVYYSRNETYAMDWSLDDIDLNDVLVSVGTFGGPLALTRNPRKMLRVKANESSKQLISMYTCSGVLMSRFEWNTQMKGIITHMSWSNEENLVVVSEDGSVYMYDIHGKPVGSFSFVADVRESGVLQTATWGNGVAILTKDFKLWVVSDLEAPFCEQFARIPVVLDFDDEKDIGMAVLAEDQNPNGTVEVLLSVPQSNSVFVVSKDRCMDMKVENGPFSRIVPSPSGEAIALFTDAGGLWVIQSDFSENHPEFNTKSSAPPHQVAWCGEDSVCLYWEPDQINRDGASLLLMIGPTGEFQKFTFDGPIHLSTEIDGVRIFSNDSSEFLQRVPEPIFDIFRIGSLTPSAMLFDSYIEFEKKNASSIKNIRSIKAHLPNAVRNCLSAAANEYNPSLQRNLLKAATYGKSFCEEFNHADFMNTCKVLRVMNAVRDFNIGIPITFEQYKRLTPNVLIDRLVNRCHHLLAYRICEYLKIKPGNVLVHWACSKVNSDEDDQDILKSIKSKLKTCEGVSYATVASVAHRAGRKDLAISLLEKEERAGEQVPLLLNMGETKKALRQAIYSGETDLVYLVLLHMKKKLEPSIFFSIINEKEFDVARNLFVSYCKEQDIEFLKVFYHALELPHEAAMMTIYESYQTDDIFTRRKLLSQASTLFAKRRDTITDSKGSEQQKLLLEIQSKLDDSIGRNLFTGLSVSDTIYNCILMGDKLEEKLKSEFGVPDKRYWWIKVAAYSKLGDWEKLEIFAKKKSPIGFKPFVEACIKRGNHVEAMKYIPKVTDAWEKVELYVELAKFKEAIETAYAQQDIDMLSYIQSKTTNQKTRQTIDELLVKLGA